MPIPTEFAFHTTSDEVAKHYGPQIEGKTILITGVSPNGLGAEVAAALAQHKPKLLILAGRSPDKCVNRNSAQESPHRELTLENRRMRQTQEAIAELASDVEIKTLIVDLSSLKQARQAAEEVES